MIARFSLRAALLAISMTMSGCSLIYNSLGGRFTGEPRELEERLSPGAMELLARAFDGIDRDWLVDFHVHLAGTGSSTEIEIHPSWIRSRNPLVAGRTGIYLSAAGVRSIETADEDYFRRLVDLIEGWPVRPRAVLLPMDRRYRDDGSIEEHGTPYHVPNHVVAARSREVPGLFVPAVSIHPFREDAVEELDRAAARGVRLVKWIPNTFGIDPSDERIDPFYRAMKRHRMVLLSHTGDEHTFPCEQEQDLGNPLLLRRPLDLGLRVVAFHSASDGKGRDLDHPERGDVDNFELFLRLMSEEKYEGLLFGEISSTTFLNVLGAPLETLLANRELHHRLVNGSDYPLVGINLLTWTTSLASDGYITWEEREWLNEIYRLNPLLFDFVLKRTIRHPETGNRFPPQVFEVPEGLRDAIGGR